MTTTWDPSNKSETASLSGSNLVVTMSGYGYAYATGLVPTGKWYCEFTIDSNPIGYSMRVGYSVGEANMLAGWGSYNDPFTVLYYMSSPPSPGDVVSIAFDTDTGYGWVALNGVWFNSGDPSNGTGNNASGLVEAGSMFIEGADCAVTGNFGSSAFAYTVPTGFSGLDTGPTEISGDLDATEAADTARIYVNIHVLDLGALESSDTARWIASRQKFISLSLTESPDVWASPIFHYWFGTCDLVESGADTFTAFSLVRSSESTVAIATIVDAVAQVPGAALSTVSISATMEASRQYLSTALSGVNVLSTATYTIDAGGLASSPLLIQSYAGYTICHLDPIQVRFTGRESGADLYTGT